MRYAAVLFDLDGTLIDSMPLFRDATAASLQKYNAALDEKFFWHWHAHRLPFEDLFRHHALSGLEPESFRKALDGLFLDLVRKNVSWSDGAEDVLLHLQSLGIPTGLVTNASSAYVDSVDAKLALRRFCNVVVTSDSPGSKPKPQPDGLLFAARQLGLHPTSCLYVGDQMFDMLAARNANMSACFLRSAHSLDATTHSVHVVDSLGALRDLVVVKTEN